MGAGGAIIVASSVVSIAVESNTVVADNSVSFYQKLFSPQDQIMLDKILFKEFGS